METFIATFNRLRRRFFCRRYVSALLIGACLLSLRSRASADDVGNARPLSFTIKAGYSPHTGVVGSELQYKYGALCVGAPLSLGLRIYPSGFGHSFFVGPFYQRFSGPSDTYNGVEYGESKWSARGIGAGYRWRWSSGWNFELGLALTEVVIDYKNSYSSAEETRQGLLPDIAVGYSF